MKLQTTLQYHTRIKTFVLTNYQSDHLGGLLAADGTAAFPNAEVVVPEAEWAFWMDPSNESRSPEGQRANFANAKRRLAPYEGRIRRVGDGAEAVPGIRALSAFGHTPGHTVFHIADGQSEMMYVADTTHRPELVARRPEFHTIFDFDPVAAEATRRRVYDRVAADRVQITGFHFPFPSNGWLVKEEGGYRFVPGDWSADA
jgi:glyoxylase-like metal-dependent hydrolase (beta-lactamase superfamily II)